MSGKSGDVPLSGNDKNENLINADENIGAADALRQEALRPDANRSGDTSSQRLDAADNKWDSRAIEQKAKEIEESTRALTKQMELISNKLYGMDEKSGTTWLQRYASVDKEGAASIEASFKADLIDPFRQSSDQIRDTLKKLSSYS